MSSAKPILGSIGGFILAASLYCLEFIIPEDFLGWLGLASLPEEIARWQGAVMWSLTHVAVWAPVALGLLVIFWANWEFVMRKIPKRKVRIALVVGTLGVLFLATGLQANDASDSQKPVSNTAATPQPPITQHPTQSGPGNQINTGVFSGTQNNYFGTTPAPPPRKRPHAHSAKANTKAPKVSSATQTPLVGDIHGGNVLIAPNAHAPVTQNNYGHPRDSNGLYQGDAQVGTADPPTVRADGTLVFCPANFSTYPDLSQPLEYREMKLNCPNMPRRRPEDRGYGGTLSLPVWCLGCTVVSGK